MFFMFWGTHFVKSDDCGSNIDDFYDFGSKFDETLMLGPNLMKLIEL